MGRYEIVKHLASGLMAELLLARARGLEGFERHFVIKRIRAEQERDEAFIEMFLAEARLAAALHHHNIVQVHDIGEDDGKPYFAMEYVHGEDLRRVLGRLHERRERMPVPHVLAIIASVAAALHHAHEARSPDGSALGIVHRDVTPSNILLGYDGNVKVVDFGIARAAMRRTETQAGMLVGKAPYMAPEQCVGGAIDRRSDVFALGIVMFELLTGRRLFKGENEFLTMSAVVEANVPPPSKHRAGVHPVIDAIVLKALARDPAQRYASADELYLAIEQASIAHNLRSSGLHLAAYMKEVFGHRHEPWLTSDERPRSTSPDFDGTLPGLALPPAAAVEDFALPAGSKAMHKPSPITRARTSAISDAPATRMRIPERTERDRATLRTTQVPVAPPPTHVRHKTVQIPTTTVRAATLAAEARARVNDEGDESTRVDSPLDVGDSPFFDSPAGSSAWSDSASGRSSGASSSDDSPFFDSRDELAIPVEPAVPTRVASTSASAFAQRPAAVPSLARAPRAVTGHPMHTADVPPLAASTSVPSAAKPLAASTSVPPATRQPAASTSAPAASTSAPAAKPLAASSALPTAKPLAASMSVPPAAKPPAASTSVPSTSVPPAAKPLAASTSVPSALSTSAPSTSVPSVPPAVLTSVPPSAKPLVSSTSVPPAAKPPAASTSAPPAAKPPAASTSVPPSTTLPLAAKPPALPLAAKPKRSPLAPIDDRAVTPALGTARALTPPPLQTLPLRAESSQTVPRAESSQPLAKRASTSPRAGTDTTTELGILAVTPKASERKLPLPARASSPVVVAREPSVVVRPSLQMAAAQPDPALLDDTGTGQLETATGQPDATAIDDGPTTVHAEPARDALLDAPDPAVHTEPTFVQPTRGVSSVREQPRTAREPHGDVPTTSSVRDQRVAHGNVPTTSSARVPSSARDAQSAGPPERGCARDAQSAGPPERGSQERIAPLPPPPMDELAATSTSTHGANASGANAYPTSANANASGANASGANATSANASGANASGAHANPTSGNASAAMARATDDLFASEVVYPRAELVYPRAAQLRTDEVDPLPAPSVAANDPWIAAAPTIGGSPITRKPWFLAAVAGAVALIVIIVVIATRGEAKPPAVATPAPVEPQPAPVEPAPTPVAPVAVEPAAPVDPPRPKTAPRPKAKPAASRPLAMKPAASRPVMKKPAVKPAVKPTMKPAAKKPPTKKLTLPAKQGWDPNALFPKKK